MALSMSESGAVEDKLGMFFNLYDTDGNVGSWANLGCSPRMALFLFCLPHTHTHTISSSHTRAGHAVARRA